MAAGLGKNNMVILWCGVVRKVYRGRDAFGDETDNKAASWWLVRQQVTVLMGSPRVERSQYVGGMLCCVEAWSGSRRAAGRFSV